LTPLRTQFPYCKPAICRSASTLIAALVEKRFRRLGDDWDIEIVEMHHRMKVDAPSGTALLLGEAAAEGRGYRSCRPQRARARRHHRRAQGAATIGFAALRGGTVAGDHHVHFCNR
jgi:4-hydroxy-tetrahydrodipicolinate reductase